MARHEEYEQIPGFFLLLRICQKQAPGMEMLYRINHTGRKNSKKKPCLPHQRTEKREVYILNSVGEDPREKPGERDPIIL